MRQAPTGNLKFHKKRKGDFPPSTYRSRSCWHQRCVVGTVFCLMCISIASASLRPEIGAKALGMSGAFISSADDSMGALWNPAGLASLQHGSLVYDLSQGAFSVGYPIHDVGTLGFSVLDLNSEDRFFHDHPNNPLGTFERGYNQVLLSYARFIGSRLQLGGNLGYNRAPNPGSRWKPSYDLGAMVKLPAHLILGARVIDISGVTISDREGRLLKQFNQAFALGVTWKPVQTLQLNSALDTTLWQLRVGAEVGAHGLALRLGTAIDLIGRQPVPDWSLGFSINVHGKHLHYAYLSQPGVEYKHLVAIGLTFDLPVQTPPSPARVTKSPKTEKPKTEKPKTEKPKTEKPKTESLPEPDTNDTKNRKSPTERIAERYGIEVELILAMVKAESGFNPNAISRSGAAGLTQLMPPTARDLGLKVPSYRNIKKPTPNPNVDERFQPLKNLEAGIRYLHLMLEKYNGNYVLSLSAYNAGPGNVQKNVPLIRETERHIGRVLNTYYQYKADAALKNTDLRRLDTVLKL